MSQERVCATCEHLRHTYTNMGMAIYHTCTYGKEPKYVQVTQSWMNTCSHWKDKA